MLSGLRHRYLPLALVALAIAGCGGGHRAAPRFFSPASVWNAPLAGDARLAPDSTALVAELGRQVKRYGPWINTTTFSVPIYTVAAGQRGLPVHIDTPSDMFTNIADATRLAQALLATPIPPGARPAAGTDRHLVIWQPSSDTMWELWLAHDSAAGDSIPNHDFPPGWHASWGARIDRVSKSSGVDRHPFGATASGLALAGGLITLDDLRSGQIDHALALSIPDAARGRFVAPATRSDGVYTGPSAIPEGTRFRLPADLNIDALHLPPLTRAIAEAAQRHGIVVRDRAGSVAFYGEDPLPSKAFGVYRQALAGADPHRLLAEFPWSRLEVVAP